MTYFSSFKVCWMQDFGQIARYVLFDVSKTTHQQTPTPTPEKKFGVTIYACPAKNILFMLIKYFCKEDQVKRAHLR